MLLGVRPDRADELVAAGHRLRVYVPYGNDWYRYSVRRLQENPEAGGLRRRRPFPPLNLVGSQAPPTRSE